MRKVNVCPRYENVNVDMIFEIKMDEKFTRNARLLYDDHTTAPPSSIAYSIFLSRKSASITFVLKLLYYFEIFACKIDNAYLNAKCRQKVWTEAGTDFLTQQN